MAHSDVTIIIKVKTMDFQTHNLLISNQKRVRNLKEDIALLIGIPIEQQHLIYCGRFLKDDQVISSYDVQHGDALHLVCTVPSMSSNGSSSSRPGGSHSTGIDGISPGTQREIPNARETLLSQYLNRIRREYGVNGTESNMNEVRGIAFYLSSPSQIPQVELLARLLSSTRNMLINQTSQLFLDFEGDLRQNLNVDDLNVHNRIIQTIQKMFEYVGGYFLELGRTMVPVQNRLIGILYDLYLADLHQRENSARSLRQTRNSFSVEDQTELFQYMPSQYQHEQPSANIRQQTNTELMDVHVASHRTGTDGISIGTQLEIPDATETLLSQYLNRIRREYILNRTNMNEVLGSAFNPSASSQGIPEVERLARLLSSTRAVLINKTSQLFLEFEGDLRQNVNVDDLSVRSTTIHTIETMFEYVGRYFHELGRVMMQVQSRPIDFQYDLYLAGLQQRQHSARSLHETRSSFNFEDLPDLPEYIFPVQRI